MFADLIGSTALHERLDAESARRLMDRYYQALDAVVTAYGGTVVKLLGDGVMAAFGVPRVAEDDAIRAVRAAVAMVQAVRSLGEENAMADDSTTHHLSIRVAVNTGEVVVSEDHSDVVGDPVNIAARLQQEAQHGDVLVGESTRRLVGELVTLAPLGAFSLKGRSETVAAHRVASLDRPATAPATAFVGRDDELRRIAMVYDAAITKPGARLVVILGSPGLGKSRLLDEFTRRLGDGTTVLTARCDAASGATFAPLAGALRALLRVEGILAAYRRAVAGREAAIADHEDSGDHSLQAAIGGAVPADDPEHTRIVDGIAALLAGTPASPEETFFVVRRFLAGLAAEPPASPGASQGVRPVVLAIDDLQWAEPLLLDLIEHLVQWSSNVPLFVLVAARPELRDARSSLTAVGGLVSEVITLGGLDAGAATRLAANIVGADELPAGLAGRVLATSEGNPLFVGELVRMLVHDGALKREGDRWTAGVEVADLEMPPTIHALLAARIERLRPSERTVLERAAVVGRRFSRPAVAHLLGGEVTDLDARLEALRRSDLIEPDAGRFLGEPVLRFHHMLIRDAAYRRLLKGTRAELHSRVADWIEAQVGDAVEHEETIGWHLEQAHRHLQELGPLDASGRVLGERAARYLGTAGRRALARDDLAVAASLLNRARDRLDSNDAARADLILDWCEALLAAGEVGPARAAIDELAQWGRDPPSAPSPTHPLSVGEGRGEGASAEGVRLRAWHTCFAAQLAVLTDPQALRATADAVATAAEQFATVGDAAGEAKAHSVHAQALSRLGNIGAGEAALDKALAAARRAHDRRRANAVLAGAPVAALWGPSPVARASGRCLDVVRVLRITQGAPAVEAVALRCQGVLEALRGRTDAARRMIASSRHMVEELGITQRLLEADAFAGLIEMLEGNAVAAEQSLRVAYAGLREHGLAIDAAQAAALLGRALLAQGRAPEAEALSHESEALAGDDLKAAIAWRGVRAEALARRGEYTAAADLARAAIDIAASTDALLDHADARLALAAVLRLGGHQQEADAENARAIELWEAKGATLLAARARGVSVASVSGAPADRATPARYVQRRVRTNAATASLSRFEAAIRAHDLDAVRGLIADTMEVWHHPTGATIRCAEGLNRFRLLFQTEGLAVSADRVATLGESLALGRDVTSFASFVDNQLDFGESRSRYVNLFEVDHRGLAARVEVFAETRLGDAVSRMYERYAELLPEGAARARAAATARTVATLLGSPDLDRLATAFAPDVEFVEHRNVGVGSARGAATLLQGLRIVREVGDDGSFRVDDVLALRLDALVARTTTMGTDRTSGGTYERQLLVLWTFGADGLLTHVEFFEPDRYDDAFSRLDALSPSAAAERLVAASPSSAAVCPARRVRANDATANAARMDAAFAARDPDAFSALLSDNVETVHHPTAVTWDRRKVLANFRMLLAAQDATFRHEPIASLGNRLALCRQSLSFSALSRDDFALFGAVDKDDVILIEVDANGRRERAEFFAAGRLGDAVARLYERYAQLLPDAGPERQRVDATARAVEALLGPFDLARYAKGIAADVEFVDHRTVGFPSGRGVGELLRSIGSLLETADGVATRVDDILALEPDALLLRWTTSGADRISRGPVEYEFLRLFVFGADGLLTRAEQFDADRVDEALARFHALRSAPARASFANMASRAVEHFEHCWRARDWDGVVATFAPTHVMDDRRARVHLQLRGEEYFASLRIVFEELASGRWTFELLATRGERLALFRIALTGEAAGSGLLVSELFGLVEVDAEGRRVALVAFDLDARDAAYAELEQRYANSENVSVRRAALTRAFTRAFAARDWDALATLLAPDLVVNDHRLLGWEPLHGPAQYIQALQQLVDLAPDVQLRVDHLTMSDPRFLYVTTWLGTREGGAFETPSVIVCEVDAMDRIRRFDQYDLDQLEAAQVRLGVEGADNSSEHVDAPPDTSPTDTQPR